MSFFFFFFSFVFILRHFTLDVHEPMVQQYLDDEIVYCTEIFVGSYTKLTKNMTLQLKHENIKTTEWHMILILYYTTSYRVEWCHYKLLHQKKALSLFMKKRYVNVYMVNDLDMWRALIGDKNNDLNNFETSTQANN